MVQDNLLRFFSFLFPLHAIKFVETKITYWQSLYLRRFFKSMGAGVMLQTRDIVGMDCISIGEGTIISKYTSILAIKKWRNQMFAPNMEIGCFCKIGKNNKISCVNSIIIEDGVTTGQNVLVCDNNHGNNDIIELTLAPFDRPLSCKGKVVIEKNVWIGDNACILSGVHIGESSIIGAGSIVTHDIPAFSVAVGNPARVIKRIE